MNKLTVAFVIFSIFFLVILKNWDFPATAKEKADILEIISVLKDEEIHITQWSLYAREKVENLQSLKEVKDYANSLKKKFPNWQWTVNEDSSHWVLAGTSPSREQKEYIKLLASTTNTPQTYIIYELKGSHFNKESEHFIKEQWSTTVFDIFRGNATIFSCVKGEFSDIINKTLPNSTNRLMSLFQAEKIESLEEKDFISISAYSPLFADSIKNNDKEMNVQIGMRSEGLGARTTLVVGTPIITIEY